MGAQVAWLNGMYPKSVSNGAGGDLNAESRRDAKREQRWNTKYAFFSGAHMRNGASRKFAHARRDPFNKDPSWGNAILKQIALSFAKKGIAIEQLLRDHGVRGEGNINRIEMKRVFLGVVPTLSDLELGAVLDAIDEDKSGNVSIADFRTRLSKSKCSTLTKDDEKRWRNPIHRVNRMPPARVEGSAVFTVGQPCECTDRLDLLGIRQTRLSFERLSDQLTNTPQSLRSGIVDEMPQYEYFTGGADATRFRRNAWMQEAGDKSRRATAPRQYTFSDPGPDLRPGFLCDHPRNVFSEMCARGGGESKYEQNRASRMLLAR